MKKRPRLDFRIENACQGKSRTLYLTQIPSYNAVYTFHLFFKPNKVVVHRPCDDLRW